MKSVPLNALPRSQTRRAGAKKLREEGRIPAVIYGRKTQPKNLEVSGREIDDLLHHAVSENLLIDLSIQEDSNPKRLALVQEIQHHPLTGKVLHVDFHEVAEDEKVTVMVPVETVGEAVGVKTDGGVLEHVLFKLKVRALPKDLPELIMVDVTNLALNQTIHLGEIKAPEGVEILGDKKIPVISVAMPRTEAEELAEAAAAAPGEVEMIKEKKEEGEEGAAPAKPGEKKAGEKKAGEKTAEKGGEKAADKGAEKKAEKPEKAEKKK